MVKPVVNDDDVESLTSPAEQSGTLDGMRSTALPPSCWASFFLDHADGTDQLGRVLLGEDDPSGAWFERCACACDDREDQTSRRTSKRDKSGTASLNYKLLIALLVRSLFVYASTAWRDSMLRRCSLVFTPSKDGVGG